MRSAFSTKSLFSPIHGGHRVAQKKITTSSPAANAASTFASSYFWYPAVSCVGPKAFASPAGASGHDVPPQAVNNIVLSQSSQSVSNFFIV